MVLTEFWKRRLEYEKRARARHHERLNAGDDTPWNAQVLEEMLIDLIERTEALEKILNPDSI